MGARACGSNRNFGGLAIADLQVRVGHFNFDPEGAGRGVSGPAEEGDLARDLTAAGGQARTRLGANADTADFCFRDKGHQLDRVQLDHRRAERSGLQQAAQFCGIALQQARKGRAHFQPLDLFLSGGDACCGAFDGSICRFHAGFGTNHTGLGGGQGRLGGGIGRIRPFDAGLGGKAALAQAAGSVLVDARLFQTGDRFGHAGLVFGDAAFGFGLAGDGLGDARAGFGKGRRAGAGIKTAEQLALFDKGPFAQGGRYDGRACLGAHIDLARGLCLAAQHDSAVDLARNRAAGNNLDQAIGVGIGLRDGVSSGFDVCPGLHDLGVAICHRAHKGHQSLAVDDRKVQTHRNQNG
mmetsp:Transcript_22776/g.37758  ORF Transcript_22776/g.37758 Transcript_22776/m.37758 type:complete len:352 (+) Transcript_22776:335-1390(+)